MVPVAKGQRLQSFTWQDDVNAAAVIAWQIPPFCNCHRTLVLDGTKGFERETEFALLRKSRGVSRINHILRVHVRTILHEEEEAAKIFEVGQRSLERLFPSFTEDSTEQAALGAGRSGLVTRGPWMLPRPAHLGPRCSKNADSRHDSRRSNSQTLARTTSLAQLDAPVEAASAVFLSALGDSENSSRRAVVANCAGTQRPNSHKTSLTSQHDDDDSEPTLAPHRRGLSAPQLQAQLSRL